MLQPAFVDPAKLGLDCDLSVAEYYDGRTCRPSTTGHVADIRCLSPNPPQFLAVMHDAERRVYIYDVVFDMAHKYLGVVQVEQA